MILRRRFFRRYALCLILCFCCVVWLQRTNLFFLEEDLSQLSLPVPTQDATLIVPLALPDQKSLQYIPTETVNAWRLRNFTVVFGIPSEDTEGRRGRRYLQRTTCWQYDGVAAQKNKYSGAMLVLYVIGRHPSQQYEYSTELIKEAQQWSDIVALDMNEGKSKSKKKIGKGKNDWGFFAMVGNSRKVFMWFDLALRTFPLARYIAKGDDDMFLRVPQYLSDFALLPPGGVYWGRMDVFRTNKSILKEWSFATGSCSTLERSVAEAFVSSLPLRRLSYLPYNPSMRHVYLKHMMHSEDLMVGLHLNLLGYDKLITVDEQCRFHDVHSGYYVLNVTTESVMVHHIDEDEYSKMLDWFDKLPITYSLRKVKDNAYDFYCKN